MQRYNRNVVLICSRPRRRRRPHQAGQGGRPKGRLARRHDRVVAQGQGRRQEDRRRGPCKWRSPGHSRIAADTQANNIDDKLKTAAKFLPNDPEELVKQVDAVSPSIAKLLQQALEQAEVIKK